MHLPLNALLARRRRGRPVPEPLQVRCERLALRSARTTASLCFLAAGSDVMARFLTIFGSDPSLQRLALRGLPFFVVVVLLISFFVYYWQNHRIRIIYSPLIFIRSGFVQAWPRPQRKTILSQLRLSNVITALLPIALVVLYLVAFLSEADLHAVTAEKQALLLGDFQTLYRQLVADGFLPGTGPLTVPYLTAADTILFIGGTVTAFGISLIMLLFITKWSTLAIVVPLRELQQNVMSTAQGTSVMSLRSGTRMRSASSPRTSIA